MNPAMAIAMMPRQNFAIMRSDKERAAQYAQATNEILGQQVAEKQAMEKDTRALFEKIGQLGLLSQDEARLSPFNQQKMTDLKNTIATKYGGDTQKFFAVEGAAWIDQFNHDLQTHPEMKQGILNKTNYSLIQKAQSDGKELRPVTWIATENGQQVQKQGTIEENINDYYAGKTKQIAFNDGYIPPTQLKEWVNTHESPHKDANGNYLTDKLTKDELIQLAVTNEKHPLTLADATAWANKVWNNGEGWNWNNKTFEHNLENQKLDLMKKKMEQDAADNKANRDIQRQRLVLEAKKVETPVYDILSVNRSGVQHITQPDGLYKEDVKSRYNVSFPTVNGKSQDGNIAVFGTSVPQRDALGKALGMSVITGIDPKTEKTIVVGHSLQPNFSYYTLKNKSLVPFTESEMNRYSEGIPVDQNSLQRGAFEYNENGRYGVFGDAAVMKTKDGQTIVVPYEPLSSTGLTGQSNFVRGDKSKTAEVNSVGDDGGQHPQVDQSTWKILMDNYTNNVKSD